MDEKTRIQKDITMFAENFKLVQEKTLNEPEKKIVELATQYYQDCQYYLEKRIISQHLAASITPMGC